MNPPAEVKGLSAPLCRTCMHMHTRPPGSSRITQPVRESKLNNLTRTAPRATARRIVWEGHQTPSLHVEPITREWVTHEQSAENPWDSVLLEATQGVHSAANGDDPQRPGCGPECGEELPRLKRRRRGRLSNRFQERSPILLIAHRPKCKLVADNKPVYRCNAISDALENGVGRCSIRCGERSEFCLNAILLAQQ